ncbi:MAG: secretin N-terminal domain-containing protein [Nitrospirae bacterium]|nr:secretin N-terminal domain-containing protein [Nitrospirota bacterium]
MKKFHVMTICLAFVVLGCATPRMTEVPETMALKAPPQLPAPAMTPEPAKAEELPPAKDIRKFSLSVRDADVRDVLLLLSKDSGVNIIADREVTGKISIDFTNLELNSALYAITRQLGFTFRIDKGFIRVTKPILETKTFRVNYITGKRTSTSTMNAAISTGNNTTGVSGTGGTNINISSGTPSSSGSSTSSSSTQGSVNITTSGTSDFWKEIRRGLEVLVFGDTKGSGDSEGSFSRGDEKTGKKLVISEIAGIVLVTDYSDSMERIEDFIKDVEQAARKQVMIQAHIIEVSLNDGYKFGIDWSAVERFNGFRLKVAQNLLTDSGVFTVDLTNNKINAFLDAMKEQGQVNILSSPKVSTMNNQRAVIKITTKEVSWLTNSYFNADGTVLLTYVTPQIDEVGIFLDVTPQIDDYGVITMQIHPSISDKIREAVYEDSNKNRNTKPVIGTREVDTMIKTHNGETVVIAGLITDKLNDTVKKIPFLSDIPVVGTAFKQVVQENQKAELVILMTPYILTTQSIADIRKEHEERLKKAGRTFEPVPAITFPINK